MFVAAKLFHKAGEGSGGGSDPHNLGYYADLTALQTAYPTGTDGDFAILGSTDTIWVWDSGTSAWKDTDTKGQVTSVNNQTGAVTLTASDVGAATAAQGAKADTAVQPGDLATVATTGAYSDLTGKPTIPAAIQVSTMPTAAVGEFGNIYQFVGTTDANYTNGYFYKCVSDGQTPATYSWTQTNVQPAGGGGLPSQTGNAGKFLTTDGTDASWSDKPLVNTATMSGGYAIGGSTIAMNSIAFGENSNVIGVGGIAIGTVATSSGGIAIGNSSTADSTGVAIGGSSVARTQCVAIGKQTSSTGGNTNICIGYNVHSSAQGSIQLGGMNLTNSEANTFKVGLFYNMSAQNYKLLDADGTIPTDRYTTTPVADGTYVPTLTISSGTATRTWGAAASAPVVPATMPTLAVADWSSNTQTVNVTGVTASNIVFVSPAPASAADYAAAGIVCTAQAADSLTFTCTTVPSNAITLSVVILG